MAGRPRNSIAPKPGIDFAAQAEGLRAAVKEEQAAHRKTVEAFALSDRRAAMAAEQCAWLIGFTNKLLDRVAGLQLIAGHLTIEGAFEYVNGERGAADQAMNVIEAKHMPVVAPEA